MKPHRLAGRVEVSIREHDPWANPIMHPVLDEDPEIDLSGPCTCRQPAVVGQDPETGPPLRSRSGTRTAARTSLIVGQKGAGKTVLLNCLRERVTAAPTT